MRLETRLFGSLQIEEDRVFDFPEGLYGFEELRRFVLIETAPGAPWKWLQSVEEPDISFVIVDPLLIVPDYAPSVPEGEMGRIGLRRRDEAVFFTIAVVPESLEQMTVNLRAPLLFNAAARLGCQVILPDDRYAVKHPVFAVAESHRDRGARARGGRTETGNTQPVATVTVGG